MKNGNKMIVIKNLGFSYKDKKIFHNLNLKFSMGEWVSVIGHNGSGKTTLAKILTGLLQHKEGQVFIYDKELTEDNLFELRSLIGIVFQNPDYQFVGFDVQNDIAFGLENQLLSRKEIQARIKKYSQMIGIENLLYEKPQVLSGGQKQKVAMASVLAMEPEIIILDEPTSFLDPQSSQEIFDIIKNIHTKRNKILITITHDLHFAFKSDKIIVLEKGLMYKYTEPKHLLEDEDFCLKYFNFLPLAIQIYYKLKNELDLEKINQKFFKKLKDTLWQYNLKM
ncbi:MAG: energy-coupling factor transporter ATPase [Candidatus Phytoplasma stylosanthis]|uniref:energy-coupling factor transporter ATPase n=1 Tax=Candidatus Phytoplasma stylosanthis TaxID=2798314 RepID=UPI00293A3320|nr:energy-coupling factor transporter ATPase [Candidatus Phytoplasma stylosanthis]MDV3167866.1 energy-coupling factor transporter ATPase [Candidatus Phytoplasma stylosanthis]MDV3170858.1 energy-coupling factor transporter ATPase [Candidatus Phytoplasma stylosanthis]MDV3173516.1 energy-coupling factor transporter ATPase [Candidatus Phytoplasma stylosanthis]MDV3174038.1 energy-coupling factor transporter ATPase [Candidatus Phytoplasma stylosanthis]MDV3202450.1 energy-coupling factor transporter 